MKKTFTKLLALIMAIAMSIGFASCRPSGSQANSDWGDDSTSSGSSSGSTEQVTLRVMHYWPEHAETFDKIKDLFEAENQNITIQYSNSDYNNMQSALNSAWMGGTMPDVFAYWSHQMYEILVPGEEFMAAELGSQFMDDEEFMSKFKSERAWDLGKIEGGYYNVPFRATGFVIYYNKTVFNEHGWTEPKSLEEFEELCAKVLDADLGVTPLYTYGTNGTFMFIWKALFNYYDVLSGRASDENYLTGRLEQTDADFEAYAAAMEKIVQWSKAGVFGTSPLEGMEEPGEASFIDGTCLMAMLNNNLLFEIEDQAKFDVGVITLPAPAAFNGLDDYNSEYGYSYGGYDGWCISSSSTKKAAAKKFVEFLSSDEIQQLFADETQSIMANVNVTYEDPIQQQMFEKMKFTALYDYVPDYQTTAGYNSTGNQISEYNASGSGNALDIIKNRYSELQKCLANKMYNNPPKEVITATYNRNEDRIKAFMEWCKKGLPED